MPNFSMFILTNALKYVVSIKRKYTWTNKRKGFLQIAKILDRFLVSPNWLTSSYNLNSEILPYPRSDHYAFFLNFANITTPKEKSSFKFESMWFRNPQFMDLLKKWLNNHPYEKGSMMF